MDRKCGEVSPNFKGVTRQILMGPILLSGTIENFSGPAGRAEAYVRCYSNFVGEVRAVPCSFCAVKPIVRKANVMVEVAEEGSISRTTGVFLSVSAADSCVMIIKQFYERGLP